MSDFDKKPFVPTDFMKFEFVGDPQIAPDASRVAFVRTVVDRKANKYRSTIMVAPTVAAGGASGPGAAAIPFTSGLTPDSCPRWSPDGLYLAFLSGREVVPGEEDGKKKTDPQIWVAPTTGGEARPVTAIKGGVLDFVWSPDSRLIAFTALVKPSGPEWLDEPAKKAGAAQHGGTAGDGPGSPEDPESDEALFKKYNESVKHITRIFYRYDGLGYFDDRRTQVFVVDVEAALSGAPAAIAVRPVQVTDGDFDHAEPAFSPDGRFLAVSACRDANADLQRHKDIWVFPVPSTKGAEEARPEPWRVTRGTGEFHFPAWSRDGKQLAFLGHEFERGWYSDTKVWVVDMDKDGRAKGEPQCVTRDFGRSFGDQSITDMRVGATDGRPVWSPDSKFLFLLASDHGTTHLHAVEMATGKVYQLTTGDWVIFGWSTDSQCRSFAFALARPDNPSDIYIGRIPEGSTPAKWPTAPAGLADLDVVARQPITRTNAELLKTRLVSRPERFTFSAPGGPIVDGWAIRPAKYQEGLKYPTVLQIHGGPMAMYTGTFFFEFQLLASAGIGVIFCNPRGSQGYGEEFCAGIQEEWGKNDYADIMACVDEAIKRFSWVDPDRLGVAGGSYGGFMTSWVIGHTDRFKAACSMRAVNNCHSFFGTSDTGFRWDEIWDATPWKGAEKLLRQSPLSYVANVKTPTLIIHSENDYRCLIEQGEQLFTALKKLGVEAEFIRYPDESHGLSRQGQPWHRVHRLKAIVDWFVRKLKETE